MPCLIHRRYGPLLLACFLLWSISAYAQKKPLPGYVVTIGGDTLLGAIYPTNRLTQQYKVEFVPVQGAQRRSFDSYQLISYTYYKNLDTVRYITLQFGGANPRRGFLQQVVAGEAQLYYYTASKPVVLLKPFSNEGYFSYSQYDAIQKEIKHLSFTPSKRRGLGRNPERSYVIYRDNQRPLIQVISWKFPEDAVTYFSDCPELVADLKGGRYRYRDIPQIVRRYNAWHKSQKPTP